MASNLPSPSQAALAEHFKTAARTYEEMTGGLTRGISRHILDNLLVTPLSSESIVLDNAAGPGITATEILKLGLKDNLPQQIQATDFSKEMIEELERHGHSEITATVMDAQDLKFDNDTFTHTFLCFAIMGLPEPEKAAKELYRTLKPGGTTYVTTWLSLCWAEPVNRALHRVKPDAPQYHGPLKPEWFTAEKLKEVLISGGFEKDRTDVIKWDPQTDPRFWDGALAFSRGPMIKQQITSDWTDEERRLLDEALEEELLGEKERGTPASMPCWIAIATK